MVRRLHTSGRPRWLRLGDANAISLADARKLAGRIMLAVAEGKDPAAERKASRSKGTFAELAAEYVERFAKKNNKAWKQPEALVRRHALPRWGKLKATEISRADVKALFTSISSPSVANQTLAAVSRIFNWGVSEELVTANPCRLLELHEMKNRERVLATESEFKMFWEAFGGVGLLEGTALKLILLLGQRPGEVCSMHHKHVKDGWWELPANRSLPSPGPARRTETVTASGCRHLHKHYWPSSMVKGRCSPGPAGPSPASTAPCVISAGGSVSRIACDRTICAGPTAR